MGLSTKTSWEVVEPGIIISEAVIIGAHSISGTQPEKFNEPIGIGLQLDLSKEGLDRPIELKLFGQPKKDDHGNIKGWGSALNVLNALKGVLGKDVELEDDLSIPQAICDEMMGKRIYTLSYMSTAAKWYSWKEVAPHTPEGKKAILQRFKDSLRRGYPKDFNPGAGRTNGDTSFPGTTDSHSGSW